MNLTSYVKKGSFEKSIQELVATKDKFFFIITHDLRNPLSTLKGSRFSTRFKQAGMVHENEIIMLVLGIGVLIFAIIHQSQIKRIYGWRNFVAGFYMLLAAWIFTIVEGFVWDYYFNILEHACYLISALLIAVWCFRLLFSHSKVVN